MIFCNISQNPIRPLSYKINSYTGLFYYATDLTKTAVSTLSFGAGQPSFPIKSMSSTCPRNRMGVGTGKPSECIRTRFRISFSAHVRTILRGLWRQYPCRNLTKHYILTIPQIFMFVKMTIFFNFHYIILLGFKVIQYSDYPFITFQESFLPLFLCFLKWYKAIPIDHLCSIFL
jgi:hypothetical protein